MMKELRQLTIVKPGGVIELASTDLPVGRSVEVIVLLDEEEHRSVRPLEKNPSKGDDLHTDEKWARFYSVLGRWKDDDDIDRIFNEIQIERQQDMGRDTPDFDEMA